MVHTYALAKKKFVRSGFTLIEIMIVITIIGILVSVVMPAVNKGRDKANITAAVMEIDALKTVFSQLYNDVGFYPNGDTSYCRAVPPANNEVDLSLDTAGLVANGSGWSNWEGPYISDVADPWGNPYFLDEDYQCMASTTGCKGLDDAGEDSSVIVSCGQNEALNDGACAYDGDNIVYRLCD